MIVREVKSELWLLIVAPTPQHTPFPSVAGEIYCLKDWEMIRR